MDLCININMIHNMRRVEKIITKAFGQGNVSAARHFRVKSNI